MTSGSQERRLAATGTLLCDLLGSDARYRRTWRVHGDRQRGGDLNQRAIAKVLALYLWDAGLRPESDVALPIRLKNVVNRALLGTRITAQTLDHFIQAFDMSEGDQRNLWSAFSGDGSVAHTITEQRGMARRQWHRTVSLFERYYVDAAKHLVRRRTVQCIEAKEDGVHSYLFNHDPLIATIDVRQGGRIGRHYEYGGGLIADDIVLTTPLRAGERASLEYISHYEAGASVAEVRRPARSRTSNVVLEICFTPTVLPTLLRFVTWRDHILGGPIEESDTPVTEDGRAVVCLPYIEQTVVGFRWQW